MNYEWTPISEPTEDDRDVIVWVESKKPYWTEASFNEGFWVDCHGDIITRATHWKDIKKP